MKLQHLSIIFVIIMIPLLLIVSYYVGLQIDTMNKQTSYDVKLQESTGEAITALEINSVEWNSNFAELQDSKRRDVSASITTLLRSLANKMGVSGISKEHIEAYVPAVVYTMYDGYYMYSNAEVPEIQTDSNTRKRCNSRWSVHRNRKYIKQTYFTSIYSLC
jgi:hypothetical protein